jgi:tetratricopeptide (TPR) repeat protein
VFTWLTIMIAKRALNRGEALSKRGHYESAEQQYKKAIRWVENAAERGVADAQRVAGYAYLGAGRVYLKVGQVADAVSNLNYACNMLPESSEALYWRGCAYGWSGNYPKAEESFTAALALVPAEASIYLQRGHARFKGGRLDEALADYLQVQRLGALQGIDSLALAVLYLHKGEYTNAERLLRTLVKQECLDAYLLLGYALEKQEKWADAVNVYEKAAGIKEVASEACERLGVVYTKLQQYEQACSWLEQAARQGRETDTVLFYYGWACYQLRRFEQCINIWTRLSQRYPQRQRLKALVQKAKYAWGCDLVRAGNYKVAIPLWTDYYSGRESDERLTQALAELHLRAAAQALEEAGSDGLDRVKEHIKKGRELAPDDNRFPFYLALLAMLDGDFEQARLLLREAIALDPQALRLRYYLALCAWENRDLNQAEEELKTVIAMDSGNLWGHRATESLVALYIEQGRWSEAADILLQRIHKAEISGSPLLGEEGET